MASSRSRSGAAKKPAGGRQAKSKKKAAPIADEVEVVEESGGMGIDDAIPIVTGVLLIASFLLVDYVLGTDYGKGLFFAP